MPTLSEFYTQVSDELKRGTSLDSKIPAKVRQALRMMEQIRTWRHMRHFASLSIDPGTANPRALSQPTGFKRMEFWRIIKPDDGGFRQLAKVDPKDVTRINEEMPQAFWMDGVDYFWLDNTPDQVYSSEMGYDSYTTLPVSTSESPYVVQNFESVLLHGTCLLMGPLLRDAKFYEMHKDELDRAMKAAVDADVEALQGNESLSVQYGWEFAERINLGE